MRLARPLEHLIDQLQRLPGIGPKSAQRLALHILKSPREEILQIATAIVKAHEKVFPCSICGNYTDKDPCPICEDKKRDTSLLCVTEQASNIMAIEKTGYQGHYFVLNNNPNLMNVKNWTDMDLSAFIKRIAGGEIKEVILALNPDIDGEVMSRILAAKASHYKVKVTRLAHGLPVGGDIEFADEITLRRAIEGRKEM
jgi:recombination protein RecR